MKKRLLTILSAALLTPVFSQSYLRLDANTIHAGFNAAGDLFYNLNTGHDSIGTSDSNVVFSIANLWIGGLDAGNQLHVAAQTYRQNGTDFWPGPIDTATGYSVNSSSAAFNKVWKLNCATVDSFVAFTEDPASAPGFTVADDIQSWPGNGDTSLQWRNYFAPFVDVDGDGVYNFASGDYPQVRGTQSLFYVYNDRLQNNSHTETGGQPLGVEVRAMPYAFNYSWDDALMHTIFIHYTIYYAATSPLYNARIGFWSDLDLAGGANKTGSDSLLGTAFHYSSSDAAGIIFLNVPMNGSIAYNNNFQFTGNPTGAPDYYGYLQQYWTDGSPLTYGGTGYAGISPTSWMYTGNPVTGTGWNDAGGSDERIVCSTGAFTLLPMSTLDFDVAIVITHSTAAPYDAVAKMKQYEQQIKAFYSGQPPFCDPHVTAVPEIPKPAVALYPNPATDQLLLQTTEEQPLPYFISDATGQIVQSGSTSGTVTTIAIGNLVPGLYQIRFGQNENATTQRFLKTD